MKVSDNFTVSEVECKCGCGKKDVSDELLKVLEAIRTKLAEPVYLSSVCRCQKHNKDVGGKEWSAHTESPCHAVDITVNNSYNRYVIIESAIEHGFNRIGVASDFVHIDKSTNLPSPFVWLY